MNKQTIIAALDAFIRQRPGLEFGNYGDVKSYSAEVRSIGRDLKDARALLNATAYRDSITADQILQAAKSAFSGRLAITIEGDKVRIDYCTGQYWPTEYRKAVASVCALCLWAHWTNETQSAAQVQRIATRELGRGIAQRWFR